MSVNAYVTLAQVQRLITALIEIIVITDDDDDDDDDD